MHRQPAGKDGGSEARLPPHSQTRAAPPGGSRPGAEGSALTGGHRPGPRPSLRLRPATPRPTLTEGHQGVLAGLAQELVRESLLREGGQRARLQRRGRPGRHGQGDSKALSGCRSPAFQAVHAGSCSPTRMFTARRCRLGTTLPVVPRNGAAAPWPAPACPPCRRPRGRAGGTNTPTTSTASGSTAAHAAAPRPALPGERRGRGGPAWAGAGRPGAAARVGGVGDAHSCGVRDTAVMSLVPAQLAHSPCLGPAQVGGAEPGRDGPGRGSQQGCPHPEEADGKGGFGPGRSFVGGDIPGRWLWISLWHWTHFLS